MEFARRVSRRAVGWASFVAPAIALALTLISCGDKATPYESNLLKNPSFEDVENGMPKHWRLASFSGLEGQTEVQYGIDSELATDGQNSWRFRGDPGTRRWYVLTQEVEVKDVSNVRVQGWIQTAHVQRGVDQHSQSNFLLTFFDANHERFSDVRFMDKRSRFRAGTNPWLEENWVVRLPVGTRYIAVSCVLGCDGTAWFDDVRLTATMPLDWQTQQTKNFVFHSLPQKPFPPGSVENQQRLFDLYAGRMGIESDLVVGYYLYPDTAAIRQALSIRGYQYISYSDYQIHTINPNENHEIIHLITDPYGVPPRVILEATVFWLHGTWKGQSIHSVASVYLGNGTLPPLEAIMAEDVGKKINPDIWVPATASFLGFLVDMWGPELLMDLYKALTGVSSYAQFERAVETVCGSPCEEVEKRWHTVLSQLEQLERTQQEQQ
jgi:hypothetical protein